MNLSVCTISFRHQLISIEQIAKWAQANHFQCIELWGAHAKNLLEQPQYNKQWLSQYNLRTTMISDYLPLHSTELELYRAVQQLSQLAQHWGANKIRTFAGTKSSLETSHLELQALTTQLQTVCDWLAKYHLTLVVEIHPNTYTDTLVSTLRLIELVHRDNLKINFDVLHVWEAKCDIFTSVDRLQQHIDHFHFKNISSVDHLHVFNPQSVYSASGSREGMVPLFEGAVDYYAFLQHLSEHENPKLKYVDASLEWFGNNCKEVLNRDRYLIQKIHQKYQPPKLVSL